MARITWQNVSAPDFSAAVAGQRTAGNLIGQAFDQISKSLGSLDYRDRSQASSAAIDQALQVQDVAAWDKLISEQGLQGLGISADRATPDLLQFVQNRRGVLEGDRTSDFEFGRKQIAAERNDANYALEQANAQIKADGLALAQEVSRGVNSKEEAERAILNLGLDPQREAAALSSLGAQPEGRFKALDQDFNSDVDAALTVSRNGFDARQRELDLQFKSDPTLQLWTDGMDRYAESTNVGESLIKRVSDYAGTQGNDTDKGEFREATGEIQKEFNRLKNKFPDLPESLIAASMESNIQATGFGWVYDDDVTFNTGAAEDQLARMDTVGERNGLESIRADYLNRRKSLDSARKKLDKAEQDLALALTRGQSGDKERQRIFELQQEFGGRASAQDEAVRAFAASAQTTPEPTPVDPNAPLPPVDADLAAFVDAALNGRGVDPRIAQSNEQAQAFGRGVRTGATNLLQTADDAVGDVAALVNRVLAGGGRGLAYGLGTFAPETASDFLGSIDRFSARTDDLAREGYIPGVPSYQDDGTPLPSERRAAAEARTAPQQPAPNQTPSTGTVEAAAQNPAQTIAAVTQEAGLPPEVSQQAQVIVSSLQQGVNAQTGQPLTQQEAQTMRRELAAMVDQVRRSYQPTGPNDPVAELLADPQKWLGL